MEYVYLFEKLEQQKIRYLICGGLAVNIYGIPRMTADIDILLDFEENNIEKFENLIKILMFQSQLPISLKTLVKKEDRDAVIKEKNLIAYSYFNSRSNYMNLDILIDTPISFNELWERKSIRNMGNNSVYLVSVEDLITLKKYANRKQDLDDIVLLSKIIGK